jgi:hypothetical protein
MLVAVTPGALELALFELDEPQPATTSATVAAVVPTASSLLLRLPISPS